MSFNEAARAHQSRLAADLSINPTTDQRLAVVKAFKAIGSQIEAEQQCDDFCLDAVTKLTSQVMRGAKANPNSYDDPEAFIAGLFSFAFADFLTQKIGGHFEVVASVAALCVISRPNNSGRAAGFVDEVANAFNGAESASMINTSAQNLDALLRNPNGQAFERLVILFQLCTEHVSRR